MTSQRKLHQQIANMAETLIRERLNMLAALLASHGADAKRQHAVLNQLVHAVQRVTLVEEVTDDRGRAVAVGVQYERWGSEIAPKLVFNQTLLTSLPEVTETMLLESVARPVAKVLNLPATMVAIALAIRTEEDVQGLSIKLSSMVDEDVITYTSLDTVQNLLLDRFFKRIAELGSVLAQGAEVQPITSDWVGMEQLRVHLRKFGRWPSWDDVREEAGDDMTALYVQPLNQVVQNTCTALSQTIWGSHAMELISVVWSCVDLSPRSFLLEAGSRLRTLNVPSPASILMAVAEAIGSDTTDLSLRLENWPRFHELQDAMERLYTEECAYFGAASELRKRTRPVSVVDIASRAFGMDEPEELPWDLPLLCWTPRETSALHDLLLGQYRQIDGMIARARCRRPYEFGWHGVGGSTLEFEELEEMPKVQVIPVGVMDIPGLPDALIGGESLLSMTSLADGNSERNSNIERCWGAVFQTMLAQFNDLEVHIQKVALGEMRASYERITPELRDSWQRRFKPIEAGSMTRAFSVLCRELAVVTGSPLLLDPFGTMCTRCLAKKPRVVHVASLLHDHELAAIWMPVKLLAISKTIGPIIVRLVKERREDPGDPTSEKSYVWLKDVPIHIDNFSGHPEAVMFHCMYGDSLQIILSTGKE